MSLRTLDKNEYPDADSLLISITTESSDLLTDSIKLQANREKKAYSIIRIPKGKEEITIDDFEKALYGYGKENSDNKPDDAIKILMEFLKDEYSKMKPASSSSKDKIVKAKEIIERFYNIKETFKNWYSTNDSKTKERIEANGGLPLEEMIELEKVWNTEIKDSIFKKLKNEQPFDIYERIKNDPHFTMSKEMAELIIAEYKNKQNDMYGLLGEAATEYCVNRGSAQLIEGVNIIVNQTARREGNSEEIKKQVESYYTDYKETLNEKVTKITSNENFELKDAFTLKANSNLKADEVFEVTIEMEAGSELITFGVSNKTSYTDNLSMKIQETSLGAIINNLYKVDPELKKYTTEIVKILKQITMYGAIFSGWGIHQSFMSFATYKDMFNQIVNDYAYIWFTEGDVGLSHADFFSIYKNEKLYLIPMSAILQLIKDKKVKFNTIDLFEYYYNDKNVLSESRKRTLETEISKFESIEQNGEKLSRSDKIMLNRYKRELKYKSIQDLYNSKVILPDTESLLKGDFTGTLFKEIINNMSIPSRIEIGASGAKIIANIRNKKTS